MRYSKLGNFFFLFKKIYISRLKQFCNLNILDASLFRKIQIVLCCYVVTNTMIHINNCNYRTEEVQCHCCLGRWSVEAPYKLRLCCVVARCELLKQSSNLTVILGPLNLFSAVCMIFPFLIQIVLSAGQINIEKFCPMVKWLVPDVRTPATANPADIMIKRS